MVDAIEPRDRTVRVEEERKIQRQLMRQAHKTARTEMNPRFEQVEKRPEHIDKRVAEMRKRHHSHVIRLPGRIATSAPLIIGAMR